MMPSVLGDPGFFRLGDCRPGGTEAVNELQCRDNPREHVIALRASSLFPAAPPSAWVATSLALMGDSIDLG